MKHKLGELVVHWFDDWRVVCSNLDRHELNFIFAKLTFGNECEKERKNLDGQGATQKG